MVQDHNDGHIKLCNKKSNSKCETVLFKLLHEIGPEYDIKKENWRILTNKEIYASVNNLL